MFVPIKIYSPPTLLQRRTCQWLIILLLLCLEHVVLALTSRKTLTLKSVKHVPSIFKNLVFENLLCDTGMRLDFQGGKIVLSYKKMYFGNTYRTDGMYKISTTIPPQLLVKSLLLCALILYVTTD